MARKEIVCWKRRISIIQVMQMETPNNREIRVKQDWNCGGCTILVYRTDGKTQLKHIQTSNYGAILEMFHTKNK